MQKEKQREKRLEETQETQRNGEYREYGCFTGDNSVVGDDIS